MNYWNIAGIVVALISAIYLIYIGRKRGYTEYFLGNIIVQGLFTLGAWLALKSVFPSFKYLPVILGALSFIFPLIGTVMSGAPDRKEKREHDALKEKIRQGKKYRDFMSFIKEHKDGIGAVTYEGEVRYSDRYPLFVEKEAHDEIIMVWNPKLQYPNRFAVRGFDTRTFFVPERDEREWTFLEQMAIRELIGEALLKIGDFRADSEDQMYIRSNPPARKKKGLRDPY